VTPELLTHKYKISPPSLLLYLTHDFAKSGLHIYFTQQIQTVVALSILNGFS